MARVELRLNSGRTWVLDAPDDPREREALLGDMATALLTELKCSFEIKWPGSTDAWGGAEGVRRRLGDEAEEYAWRASSDEFERERLAEAFRAGFWKSPKPVTYPLR